MQKLHVAAVDPATGQSRSGAQLRVYIGFTLTLASLYADDEVTRLPNPLTADTAGRQAFRVVDGEYDIEVSGTGFTPYKITGVQAADKDNFATLQDVQDLISNINIQGNLTYVDAVLEYGAKGDGATDDRAAIQAALNSRKGPVYLRPGTYRIGGAITMQDSATLLGAGTHLTQIKPFTNAHAVITATNAAYLTVRDMTLVSPVANGGSIGIWWTTNCNWGSVEKVHFIGHWQYAFRMDSTNHQVMRDCYMESVAYGIGVYNTTQVAIVNTQISICEHGIVMQNVYQATLSTVYISEINQTGINMPGGNSGVSITDCTFRNATMRGTWFLATVAPVAMWMTGIGVFNVGPIIVPPTSDYWLMENVDLKTNTGHIWSTSSIRAWGQLGTNGFVGQSMGILSIVRLGNGQCRVNFKTPALFSAQAYAVNVTVVTGSTFIPVVAGVTSMTAAYCELNFIAAQTGLFAVDIPFNLQAGGTVLV